MEKFNHVIYTEGQALSFSFSSITVTEIEKILIEVTGSKNSFSFTMHKNNSGEWKLAEPMPLWLVLMERQLREAIERQAN